MMMALMQLAVLECLIMARAVAFIKLTVMEVPVLELAVYLMELSAMEEEEFIKVDQFLLMEAAMDFITLEGT